MTTIAAIKTQEGLLLVADTMLSYGNKRETGFNKITKLSEDLYIAICGRLHANTVLRSGRFTPRQITEGEDLDTTIYNIGLDIYHSILNQEFPTESPAEGLSGALIGVFRGVPFRIGFDGNTVIASEEQDYIAEGSGSDYFMGAIEAIKLSKEDSEQVTVEEAFKAMDIATSLDSHTGGSYNSYLFSVEDDSKEDTSNEGSD